MAGITSAPIERNHYELQMYHRYKHQRATRHIIELYDAHMADPTGSEKAEAAVAQLESINLRIRDLNHESGLSTGLGVIDYEVFLYCWKLKQDPAIIKGDLEGFCTRKQYMKGWASIPPTHNYGYFSKPEECCNDEWEILIPWLHLIWAMLKRQPQLEPDFEFIDDIEDMFLRYLGGPGEDLSVSQGDALTILISLREMSRLLNDGVDAEHVQNTVKRNYMIEREKLRRMCEFQGFPCDWIPAQAFLEEIRG